MSFLRALTRNGRTGGDARVTARWNPAPPVDGQPVFVAGNRGAPAAC